MPWASGDRLFVLTTRRGQSPKARVSGMRTRFPDRRSNRRLLVHGSVRVEKIELNDKGVPVKRVYKFKSKESAARHGY